MSQYSLVLHLGFVCAWSHSQKGNGNESKGRQQTSLPKGCKGAGFPQRHHFPCINPALKWQQYCCEMTWEAMEQWSGADGGDRTGSPEDVPPPPAIMHPTAPPFPPPERALQTQQGILLLRPSVSNCWGSSFALWMPRGQIQIAGLKIFLKS